MSSGTGTERLASWEIERTLSYARWAAAGAAAIQAVLIQPGPQSRPFLLEATFALGVLLALANTVLQPALRRRRVSVRLAGMMFAVDLLAVFGLVWLYLDNPDATQWVLFMIIQLEAAYRWEMRGAVGTALLSSAFYAVTRYTASRTFGFPFAIESITYVLGLTVVQGLVVGGMARRMRAERDASLQLHEAALALNEGLDRHAILSAVARESGRLSGAEYTIVWVPVDGGGFAPAASSRLPTAMQATLRLPPSDPVFGRSTVATAFTTARPVVRTQDDDERPVLESATLPQRWRTVVSVPIVHDGQPIGVLSCYLADPRAPSPEATGRLEALSALAGVAIANAAAYDRERSTLETLRTLDKLKDDFLSTVSHELRTPLTVVEGFATTLRQRWDDLREDQRRDLVDRLSAQASGLHERIGDLLEFSRLQSGEYRLKASEFALAPLVAETVNRLEPTIQPRPVVVRIDDELVCHADQSAVSQILENLLVNAARYSPKDAEIDVHAEEVDDGWVEVCVADRGIGVPDDERDRIFERFYRGQHDDVRRVRGTGVGLAIVAELAAAHGGRASVARRPEGGSSFTVRLPGRHDLVPPDLLPDPGDAIEVPS